MEPHTMEPCIMEPHTMEPHTMEPHTMQLYHQVSAVAMRLIFLKITHLPEPASLRAGTV